jgi:hypothetical protein
MPNVWVIFFLQQSCVDLMQVHLSPILYYSIFGKENNKVCNPMVWESFTQEQLTNWGFNQIIVLLDSSKIERADKSL